ncbi:MAG: methyltransferase domain-containing protein, partial [Bacteroidales bacterium]|nr:methyltransferase domain-containing protein [Bacteroidales bacterium]
MSVIPELQAEYWDKQYSANSIGWDIGYVATPLKEYFDQLENKRLKILVPGAGNAYEAEYLMKNGFKNVFVLDFSDNAIASFLNRYPDFPKDNIFQDDFFEHNGNYDLIVEQAFFTSFPEQFRLDYAKKMHQLLNPNGKLVGLWFTHKFNNNYPPYG